MQEKTPTTMTAVVVHQAGSADVLQVETREIPAVKAGWVLIKIHARGVNRAEIMTRQGLSPSVRFPRILGIECVGEIANPSDSSFSTGQKVMSMMGELGRQFDGSYAEYALVPSDQVYPIQSDSDWTTLAALPEMYYTAYGSLFARLRLTAGESLLIRGATSSVGLAALQLAKASGCRVYATTRHAEKTEILHHYGADDVRLDLTTGFDRPLPPVDKVLELVGASTIKHSLSHLKPNGILCMTGVLGGWVVPDFEPMTHIPQGAYLTGFDSTQIEREMLADMLDFIRQHAICPVIAKVFHLTEMAEVHRFIENNTAIGKVVVVNE